MAQDGADHSGLYLSSGYVKSDASMSIEAGAPGLPAVESQLHAGKLMTTLKNQFADTFVTFGRVAPDVDAYFVNFKEKPAEEVLKQLSGLPYKVTVSWGFPASAAELEAAADELTASLDADPRVSSLRVGGTATQVDQGIEVRVDLVPDAAADQAKVVADAVASVDAARRSDDTAPAIPVVMSDAKAGFAGQMDVKGGYGTNCSSNTGFTASWNGNLGVITAAHGPCSAFNVYNSASGVVNSFNMPRRPTVSGVYVDVWFAKTQPGSVTTYRFRDSMSSDLVVTGVLGPYLNMNVCKFGTVTGRSCGQVTPLYVTNSASFCATNNQGPAADGLTYCRMWEANRLVTSGGDSGGPWFLGQAAVGITGGDSTTSIFTAATSIEVQQIIIRQQ